MIVNQNLISKVIGVCPRTPINECAGGTPLNMKNEPIWRPHKWDNIMKENMIEIQCKMAFCSTNPFLIPESHFQESGIGDFTPDIHSKKTGRTTKASTPGQRR